MASRTTALLGAVTAAALGGVVGYLSGRSTSGSAVQPTRAASSAQDPELLVRLRRIEESIVAIQVRLELGQPLGERTATGPQLDQQALDEALAKIAAMSKAAEAAAHSLPHDAHEALKGPGYATVDELVGRMAIHASQDPEKWGRACNEEFKLAHWLWTSIDVLERYGSPKRFESHGWNHWYYGDIQVLEEACGVEFRIEDGWAAEVNIFCR